jgi:hypothetical protein
MFAHFTSMYLSQEGPDGNRVIHKVSPVSFTLEELVAGKGFCMDPDLGNVCQ